MTSYERFFFNWFFSGNFWRCRNISMALINVDLAIVLSLLNSGILTNPH